LSCFTSSEKAYINFSSVNGDSFKIIFYIDFLYRRYRCLREEIPKKKQKRRTRGDGRDRRRRKKKPEQTREEEEKKREKRYESLAVAQRLLR